MRCHTNATTAAALTLQPPPPRCSQPPRELLPLRSPHRAELAPQRFCHRHAAAVA